MLLGVQPRRQEQRYRIDATIVLFGVPVYRRKGVGSGWARIEESAGERWLRFAAGSLPGNAQGLNRLGFVEERASQDGSTYFGFMTASGEESFSEAQKALAAAGSGEAKYTAIAGEVKAGRAESRTAKFVFPSAYDWSRWEELYPVARSAFGKQAGGEAAMTATPQEAAHSFLHTLTGHMQAGVGTHERAFVYGNREMLLRSKVERDGALLRMDGRTIAGKKTLSAFRLWYRDGAVLPDRVEVQVKSFLRLTLV